jgi:antitoxin ParD1/3/4
MNSLQIDIPATFVDFLNQRVSEQGYASPSQYVQALIEADQNRVARQELEAEMIKGLESGEPVPMTDDDWQAIRNEVRSRYESRTQNTLNG